MGLFIDAYGKATPRSTVHWRSAPLGCLYLAPYLISVLPDQIHIRQFGAHVDDSERLQQSLPLRDAMVITGGGGFGGDGVTYVSSQSLVYALLPPLDASLSGSGSSVLYE